MNRNLLVVLTVGLSILAVGCADPAFDSVDQQGRTPTGSEPYHGMIQYRAKDSKQAILDPELVNANEAIIASGTKVIGVFVGGEARAYPLFILNNHQVVNDKVGGIPLSASW